MEVPTCYLTEPKNPPPPPIRVGPYQPAEGPAVVSLRHDGPANVTPENARMLAAYLLEAADQAERRFS